MTMSLFLYDSSLFHSGKVFFTNVQIVSVLRPTLDQHFPEQMGVRIIAEPGRYFAASAFTLAVNIIAKRTITASDSTSSSPGN